VKGDILLNHHKKGGKEGRKKISVDFVVLRRKGFRLRRKEKRRKNGSSK